MKAFKDKTREDIIEETRASVLKRWKEEGVAEDYVKEVGPITTALIEATVDNLISFYSAVNELIDRD